MGEKLLKNPDLISLWDRYFDPDILERLDILKEWNFVSKHANSKLSYLIAMWNHDLTRNELEIILKSFETLLSRLNNISYEDQSLFIFNILPILEYNIKNDRLDILKLLTDQLINNHHYEHRGTPSKVIIELTNNCNLNCKMCGVGSMEYSLNRTMSLDFFHQIIDMISGSADIVRLNGLGESTIIPHFRDYLSVLKDKNMQLELVTNLSFRNQDLLNDLLKMDFNLLISCDSPNPDRLVSIRRGLNIDNFMDNLDAVKNYKRRDSMRNHIIFTIMEENLRDLPDMIEFASKYNIAGVIGNIVKGDDNGWKLVRLEEILETFKKAEERAREEGIELRLPNQIEGVPIKENFGYYTNSKYCPTFKDEIFIRYNGDVCPCNMMNPYIYGNIKRHKIEEILNGFHKGIFSKLVNTKFRHPYCENCYYIRENNIF